MKNTFKCVYVGIIKYKKGITRESNMFESYLLAVQATKNEMIREKNSPTKSLGEPLYFVIEKRYIQE